MTVPSRTTHAVRAMMRRPVKLQASTQALPGVQQNTVPGGLIDKAVQPKFSENAVAIVMRIDGGGEQFMPADQFTAKRVVPPAQADC